MGAGCTISSTNKSFMSMQVVSPQKKNKMKVQIIRKSPTKTIKAK